MNVTQKLFKILSGHDVAGFLLPLTKKTGSGKSRAFVYQKVGQRRDF